MDLVVVVNCHGTEKTSQTCPSQSGCVVSEDIYSPFLVGKILINGTQGVDFDLEKQGFYECLMVKIQSNDPTYEYSTKQGGIVYLTIKLEHRKG